MELSIENLSKRFRTKVAVNNISIAFQPGIYGLLGANGAGKTTLMRMVCNILEPTSGRIFYNEKDIRQLGESYLEVLGYLPQNFGYYPDFTAKEYLDFIAAVKGLKAEESGNKVAELLEMVNLSNVAGKKIRTYSGGMKQRLGIAQAIINNPSILILDEPTAGLDPKERMRFRNLIAELAKDKIVILSTHIVSDIDNIADNILMIKDGSLILNSSVVRAVHSIDGKVWNCKLHQSKIDEVNRAFRVVSLHHELKNEVLLRIVSDSQPFRDAVNVTPTLDDLYLYYFQDEEIKEEN